MTTPRISNDTTVGELHKAGYDMRVVPRSSPGALDGVALPEAGIEGRPQYTVHFLRKENALLIAITGKDGTARQVPLPAGLITAEPEATDDSIIETPDQLRALKASERGGLASHIRPG